MFTPAAVRFTTVCLSMYVSLIFGIAHSCAARRGDWRRTGVVTSKRINVKV